MRKHQIEIHNQVEIEKNFELFLIDKQNDLIKKTSVHVLAYLEKYFYEWSSDNNPYDDSGEIKQTNFLNKQKVKCLV